MHRNDQMPHAPQCPPRPVLKGQAALVTGGSSGIGKGIALALAEAGADVVVNYAGSEEKARKVVEELSEHGGRYFSHQADVSKEAQIREMFARIRAELDTLHILVNNAGIQKDAPFDEMTLEQWQAVLSVNLTGQFLCAREAVREFKRRGVVPDVSCAAGKIICISSVHEAIPWACHANYAASKGGVMMLMRSVAQEVAPDRIRVNSIAPGAIQTPLNRQAWGDPEAYERLMRLVPYNRIGQPEDIGRAAAWLASDASDYVTGATLFVDGGMMLYPGFASGG